MNPFDAKRVVEEAKKILEEVREGAPGVEAVFIAVKKKDAIYFKERGNLLARQQLKRRLKRIL